MEQQTQPAPPSEGVPTPQRGGFEHVVRMFYEPSAVFHELAAKPAWLAPLVVLILFAIGLQLVTAPRLDMEGSIREQLERFGQADKFSAEQIKEMAAQRGSLQKYGGILGAALGIPLLMAVLATFYLLALKAVGSEVGFVSTFSLLVYASTPPALVKMILTGAVAFSRESFTQGELQNFVRSSLGAWLPADAPKALLAAGSVLDLFNLWEWVLLVFGLQIVGPVKRGTAIGIVAVLWGLYTLVKMAFVMLF